MWMQPGGAHCFLIPLTALRSPQCPQPAMEGPSVLSPSSWEKRRAWARQSRCWRTTVVEAEAAAAMQDAPELQPPHLDDVFLEGSSSSKIQTWLQDCGHRSTMENPAEELGVPGPYGGSSHVTSFEDDLTLGAEALLLPRNDRASDRALLENPGAKRHLHLGQSMASSALSTGTNKTSSSITEILEWCQEDAEEILYNLGFVQDELQATARIPSRFFAAPSQARGIDFQLFLKAQVQRMEMEDPCLTLASRFQQVQALAVTADAFFCLYSYVSKTPVQKISPAHFFWASTDIPDLRVVPAKPEALSPVDRLKKAVSKMCLYTSPKAEKSPGGDAGCRRSSLGQVVQEVMERARDRWFCFDRANIEGMRWTAPEGSLSWCQGPCRAEPTAGDISLPLCHGGEATPAPSSGKSRLPAVSGLHWDPVGPVAGTDWGHVEELGDSGYRDTPGCPAGQKINLGSAAPWASIAPLPGLCHEATDTGRRTWGHREGHRGGMPPDTCSWDHSGLMPALWGLPGADAGGGFLSKDQWQIEDKPSWGQPACPQAQEVAMPSWGETLASCATGGRALWVPEPSLPMAESFEMEEVPSASEDEEDAPAAEANPSAPALAEPRRRLMLHATSSRSDSSGFVEESAPGRTPMAQLTDAPLPPGQAV
ncbi:protein TESPA1 isoform X1 [Alligator mississippiensis]|uniref:protein TESPA1 isoform X1 n=2 Tax=Alligator mississippiensis TaxID=8496 RepID=UPI0028777FE2|nr:protein TESPA1 isoform X1 [Alligator mississippiensis]